MKTENVAMTLGNLNEQKDKLTIECLAAMRDTLAAMTVAMQEMQKILLHHNKLIDRMREFLPNIE